MRYSLISLTFFKHVKMLMYALQPAFKEMNRIVPYIVKVPCCFSHVHSNSLSETKVVSRVKLTFILYSTSSEIKRCGHQVYESMTVREDEMKT